MITTSPLKSTSAKHRLNQKKDKPSKLPWHWYCDLPHSTCAILALFVLQTQRESCSTTVRVLGFI
jgi:hypothetical protein